MSRRTMTPRLPRLAAALLAAVVAPATACAQNATFTGIGFLNQESRGSWVYGLSADGSTPVGDSRYSDGLGGFQAMRWRAETGIEGLGLLSDTARNSTAFGASTNGGVIVGAGNSDPGWQAFRWTESGGMVGLGDLPGGDFWSQAKAVSGDGSIVVGSSRGGGASNGLAEAFRWTEQTGMVGLGFLPGGSYKSSSASGISDDGKVIVGGSNSAEGGRAFRWSEETGMVSLGTLPDGFGSGATAISPNGHFVVGQSAVKESNGNFTRAFIWSEDAGMTALPNLPVDYLGLVSRVADVADDGTAVGSTDVVYHDYSGRTYATVWLAGKEAVTIEALLLDYGIDVLAMGWQLEFAYGVSADGRTIAGHGLSPNGFYEGWIAHIPIPTPHSLAIFALAVVFGPRRSR
ncbi:PEP-CTERM sorting domain-containing protein [Synechococcales cyanobacterium CNB]|nr:PEP-CTERM sorting domain-containing protein [Synechococcales cyanobacterium CNB]